MDLNVSQKRALNISEDMLVSAGAGSGKTRVLVARFLYLLENVPGLSLDNIVAITFTDKAAAELRERIHKELEGLYSRKGKSKLGTYPSFPGDDMSSACIGTIHSFCRRILGEFALQSGVDAEFRILDENETEVLIRDAIDFTLFSLARKDDPEKSEKLRILLRYLGAGNLQRILHDLLRRRDITLPHIRRFLESDRKEILEWNREAAEKVLIEVDEFREVLESIHASCLKAIADIFMIAAEEYENLKGHGVSLDFDDLLIKAAQLLETNIAIRDQLKRRYRYFLVDEFQDTDPLQWRIFQILTEDQAPGRLFLVGDPKQSIYGFRRADVRLFYKAREYIREKNMKSRSASGKDVGIVQLRDNYRSDPAILDFVNYFFSRIMPPQNQRSENSYDVSYESLIAQKSHGNGAVEILYANPERLPDDDPFRSLPLEELEAEFIASRVKELLSGKEKEPLTPGDFALLLRSRGYLKSYEEALIRHGVPFITIGGVGFYERQEIFDIANFLRFLVNPENDPALFGLLRSPFLSVPDSLIFQAAQIPKKSLWERLRQFAREDADTASGGENLLQTVSLLNRRLYESQRKPLATLLNQFLQETGSWARIASGEEGIRRLENVEKLMEQVRQFDRFGFGTIGDFTEELMSRIENADKEGEAPQPVSEVNAVKIMTIHKAKGLEFPVVVLPGLSSSMRTLDSPFRVDENYGFGVKMADPESSFEIRETCLFTALKELDGQKQACEEKRLFYVGCTRAEKMLILSCAHVKRKRGETRQTLLDKAFHLEKAAIEETPVKFTIDDRERLIPVKVSLPKIPVQSSRTEISGVSRERPNSILDGSSKEEILSLLLPLPEKNGGEAISVTRINDFNECAFKYYLERLLGWKEDVLSQILIPENAPVENIRQRGSRPLIRGVILHRLIQDWISCGDIFEENPSIALPLEDEINLSPEERAQLVQDVKKAWRRVRKIRRMKELVRLEKKYAEIPFTISLENGFLQGRVDLCFFENEQWKVVDFKTGFRSSKDLFSEKNKYEIQMECYGLFLSVLASEQEVFPVCLYFIESDQNIIREYDRSDLERIRKRIESLIEKERSFRKQYSGKGATYGKDILKEIRRRVCSECERVASDECPCKLFQI